jgi:hypothetical protein
VSPLAAVVRRRVLITGGVCVALLFADYALAIWTAQGQRFEDAVLGAADRVADGVEGLWAMRVLNTITVSSVVGAAIAVAVIGSLRRRLFLGLLAVGLIAASVATVELLRWTVLRPILLNVGDRREDQSFPILCAVTMVVPHRFRGATALLASVCAASVGGATVTASWHRPSDVIGSDLVVVIFACVAVAVLCWRGWVSEAALPTTTGRSTRGLLAGAGGAAALLVFAVLTAVVGAVPGGRGGAGPGAVDGPFLVAGRAVALSACAAVPLALLGLLHRVDLHPPHASEGDCRS